MTSAPAAYEDDTFGGRAAVGILGVLLPVPVWVAFPIVWGIIAPIQSSTSVLALILACMVNYLVFPLLFGTLSGGIFVSEIRGLRGARGVITVFGLFQTASVAVVIVVGFQTHPPLWIPIAMIAGAAGLFVVALALGPRMRPRWPSPADLVAVPWMAIPTRRRQPFVLILVLVPVLVGGLAIVLEHPWEVRHNLHGGTYVIQSVGFAVTFALYSAGLVVVFRYMSLMTRVSSSFSRDVAFRRKIARLVYRPNTVAAGADEGELARRWAAYLVAMGPSLPIAYGLLFAGLAAQQSSTIVAPYVYLSALFWVAIATMAVMAVAVVVVFAVTLRRTKLAREYLARRGQPAVWVPTAADAAVAAAGEPIVQPNG